jgi:hypothetical protein
MYLEIESEVNGLLALHLLPDVFLNFLCCLLVILSIILHLGQTFFGHFFFFVLFFSIFLFCSVIVWLCHFACPHLTARTVRKAPVLTLFVPYERCALLSEIQTFVHASGPRPCQDHVFARVARSWPAIRILRRIGPRL